MTARTSSPSIYNGCLLQAVPKRVLRAECRAQQTRRKRPGPNSSTGGGSGQRLGRLQTARVPGWQTVDGSFFFSLCTPNKLRTFFFSLKSPGRKWGQEEWQAEAATHSEGFLSWGSPEGFQVGCVPKPLELHTQILCVCMFSGTKGFSLLSAPQRSS